MALRQFVICFMGVSSLLCMIDEKAIERIDKKQMVAFLDKALSEGKIEEYFRYVEQFDKRIRFLLYDLPLDDHKRTALFLMIRDKRDTRYIEKLVNEGADILACAWLKRTPVHVAAAYGTRAVIDCLLKGLPSKRKKEILSMRTGSRERATPLHVAARYGNVEALEYLISIGADINAESIDHATPVYLAARDNQPEAIACLYKHGANILKLAYAENSPVVWTPLEIAKYKKEYKFSALFRNASRV